MPLNRIRHLRYALKVPHISDRAGRSVDKRVLGATLVVEGVSGRLRNIFPHAPASRGNPATPTKKAQSMKASLVFMAVGVGIISLSGVSFSSDFDEPVVAEGQVVAVEEASTSEGEAIFRETYTFKVDRQDYTLTGEWSTDRSAQVGTPVDITYDEGNPSSGRRTDEDPAWYDPESVQIPVLLVGAAILLGPLTSFLLGAVLVIAGFRLFAQGHIAHRSADVSGSSPSLLRDLSDMVGKVRRREVRLVEHTP